MRGQFSDAKLIKSKLRYYQNNSLTLSEVELKVLQLRGSGFEFKLIAEVVDRSESRCVQICKGALIKINALEQLADICEAITTWGNGAKK